MKRTIGVGVSVVVLVAGLVLVTGGDEVAEAEEASAPTVRRDVPVRGVETQTHDVAPKVRADDSPKPARGGGSGEPTTAEVAAAPYVSFSSRAAPRWQGVSLELKRLGQGSLADETWSMAGWIRGQRQDADRDDVAILEAQLDLLARVEALTGLDGPAREALASVRETVAGYRADQDALP